VKVVEENKAKEAAKQAANKEVLSATAGSVVGFIPTDEWKGVKVCCATCVKSSKMLTVHCLPSVRSGTLSSWVRRGRVTTSTTKRPRRKSRQPWCLYPRLRNK